MFQGFVLSAPKTATYDINLVAYRDIASFETMFLNVLYQRPKKNQVLSE